MKPLILITEDDRDMALLNARLLKRQGYNVLITFTGAEARTLACENSPDLFVLDIELPDSDGFSLCKEIRQYTDAPVLFLTGKVDIKDKVTGLGIGGDYYLTKPYDRNEFLAVIESLLRKEKQMKKKIDEVSVIRRGALTLKFNEKKAFVDGRDAELTTKEFAILMMLVQNEDKELTYRTIYESIWGMSMNNNSSALRQQISRLKKKLDEDEVYDFSILNDWGKGYRFTMK